MARRGARCATQTTLRQWPAQVGTNSPSGTLSAHWKEAPSGRTSDCAWPMRWSPWAARGMLWRSVGPCGGPRRTMMHFARATAMPCSLYCRTASPNGIGRLQLSSATSTRPILVRTRTYVSDVIAHRASSRPSACAKRPGRTRRGAQPRRLALGPLRGRRLVPLLGPQSVLVAWLVVSLWLSSASRSVSSALCSASPASAA